MKSYERLIDYVRIWTTSDEDNAEQTPSAACEMDLGRYLTDEMESMGIRGVTMTENAYVYGWIPATPGYEHVKTVGFIAHMDTAPEFNGRNVNPQIHADYDGEDLAIGAGLVLKNDTFPHLKGLKGRTLITTDGTSLLGADDKAGIANIMTMAEMLLADEIPHGKVALCFCPDEEIGHGASLLDIEGWGADFAYTCDGGAENDMAYENFNAYAAEVEFNGFNIHPGDSKDKMINASLVAMEFNAMLPGTDVPSCTEGYEGFFHLCSMSGSVEKAELSYIIRDHDRENIRVRNEMMKHIAKILNEKYGAGTVKLSLREQYKNMKEYLLDKLYIVDYAKEAMEEAGLVPEVSPIRGGTDGAQLTFRGLPCPNLGTGGYAFHGPYEHITVEGMDLAVQVLLNIVKKVASAEA